MFSTLPTSISKLPAMRRSLAFAALAFAAASPGVLARAEPAATFSALAESDAASATSPKEPLVTKLSSAQLAAAAAAEEEMSVDDPPPMFDPPEPRPGSIFVSDSGMVLEQLPRPPPLQESRPEVISKFEASRVHPQNNPYPPDFSDAELNHALYVAHVWVHASAVLGALGVLLFVATTVVWTCERLAHALWRARRGSVGSRSLDPIEAWYEQGSIARSRRRSGSLTDEMIKKC